MKDNLNYIDDLYKSSLQGLSVEAGSRVWTKLYWALFWMRYKWFLVLFAVVLLFGFGIISLTTSGDFNAINVSGVTSSNDTESNFTNESNKSFLAINHEQIQADEVTSTEPELLNKAISETEVVNSITNEVYQPAIPVQQEERTGFENEQQMQREDLIFSILIPKDGSLALQTIPDSLVLGDNRQTNRFIYGNKKKSFSVNIYAGSLLSSSMLSGYDNEYLTYRNDHETDEPGWSVGTDFNYHLKNWTLSAGLNYSVYRTYRDYNYTYESYDPDNSYFDYDTTWVWIYDAPDLGRPMVKNIDSSWVKVYNEHLVDNSGYNQVSYFEIPVLVGYTIPMNRWFLEVKTGLSVGFLMSSSYKVPDLNNYQDVVEVTRMNSIMYNYLASVALHYKLDKDFTMFIAPNYKQNLHSIFSKDYPVKEQFRTFGLNLGISYKF